MSHKRRWFGHNSIIPIVIASIGIGMICAIILPFWVWIVGAGIGLVAFAWLSYCDK